MNRRRMTKISPTLRLAALLAVVALLNLAPQKKDCCGLEEEGDKPKLYKVRVTVNPPDHFLDPFQQGTFTFTQVVAVDSPQSPPVPLPWTKAVPGAGLSIVSESGAGMTRTVVVKAITDHPEDLPGWTVWKQQLSTDVRIGVDISGVQGGFAWEPRGYGWVGINPLPGQDKPWVKPENDPAGPRIVVQRYLASGVYQKIDKTVSSYVDVRNAGGSPLVITSCTITTGQQHFGLPSSWAGRTIGPKCYDALLLFWHPRDPGEVKGTLEIVSNDPKFPKVTVWLVTTGVYNVGSTGLPMEQRPGGGAE